MKKKLLSILLSLAMVITMMPAQTLVVSAATKTKATVSTQDGLKKALKNKKLKTLTVKTAKVKTFSIKKGTYKKVHMIIDAQKSTVKNESIFKKITIKKNKTFVMDASKGSIAVSKGGKVNEVRLTKSNSKINFNVSGELKKLNVEKKSEVNIKGTTKKAITVNAGENADETVIKTSVKVNAKIGSNAEVKLSDGSEGSSIAVTNKDVKVTVVNNTDATYTATDVNGKSVEIKKDETVVIGGDTPAPTPTPEPTPPVPPAPTFKAVYDTTNDANTLTFYYDAVDHSGDGVTVYEGTGLFNDAETAAQKKWGYNGNRGNIKSVVIDASVEGYSVLTSTAYMFQGMTAATNISGAEYLDVSNVTDMSFMFNNFGGGSAGSSTTLNVVPDVSKWNTGNVTNMTAMFESYGCLSSSLDKVPDVSNWNTGNVTNMTFMFQKYGHESQNFNAVPDVSSWTTDKVTDMSNMFKEYGYKSTALNTVPDVSNRDTASVTNMSGMFCGYGKSSTALTAVPDVSGWNTAEVTTMADMFNGYGASSTVLTAVPDVSKWNTAKVTTIRNMFQDYGNISVDFELDLSRWDLSKITGNSGDNVFKFTPKTFKVTIPAKTGEVSNESGKWYYGNGTNHIAPPTGKTFTPTLAGVFTVCDPDGTPNSGDEKKVHFSQGNLTYNVTDTKWAFYEHQYDCATGYDSNLISLFTWGYDAETSIVPDGTNYVGGHSTGGTFSKTEDWGYVFGGESSVWHTLTIDEWSYLFTTRTMTHGKDRYSNAMSSGVTIGGTTYKGVFLYPDDYNGDGVSSSMTWDAINAAGIVFLPAAGYRFGSTVYDVDTNVDYWSSTADDSVLAYVVHVTSHGVMPNSSHNRFDGCSVRLVTEVN